MNFTGEIIMQVLSLDNETYRNILDLINTYPDYTVDELVDEYVRVTSSDSPDTGDNQRNVINYIAENNMAGNCLAKNNLVENNLARNSLPGNYGFIQGKQQIFIYY